MIQMMIMDIIPISTIVITGVNSKLVFKMTQMMKNLRRKKKRKRKKKITEADIKFSH